MCVCVENAWLVCRCVCVEAEPPDELLALAYAHTHTYIYVCKYMLGIRVWILHLKYNHMHTNIIRCIHWQNTYTHTQNIHTHNCNCGVLLFDCFGQTVINLYLYFVHWIGLPFAVVTWDVIEKSFAPIWASVYGFLYCFCFFCFSQRRIWLSPGMRISLCIYYNVNTYISAAAYVPIKNDF